MAHIRRRAKVNFWFGVILLQLVLALSLTGYLLPWDQKGFWATKSLLNLVHCGAVLWALSAAHYRGGARLRASYTYTFFCPARRHHSRNDHRSVTGPHYLFRRHG